MTEESMEPEVLERQEACDDSLKDMEETIYQLRANRKIRLALLTRQMNIVKGLLDDDVNVLEVRQSMVKYRKLLDEFKDAHKSFQHLLSEEERRIDLEKWFQPKMDAIQDFISCVTTWLSSTAVTKDVEVDAPADNVSVVSFRSKESTQSSRSSRRSYSSRSSHSSHLSALIEAEAEQAALKARYAALKEKHALEEKEQKLNLQKEQIRKQKETLEIESELAATTARINILKEVENPVIPVDAMNEYIDKEQDALELKKSRMVLGDSMRSAMKVQNVRPKEPHSAFREQKESKAPLKHPKANPVPLEAGSFVSAQAETHYAFREERQHLEPVCSAVELPRPDVLHHPMQVQTHAPSHPGIQPSSSISQPAPQVNPTPSADTALYSILQKQTDITDSLVKQTILFSLPQKEVKVFDGEPLEFRAFIRSFEDTIESKIDNDRDRLCFLEQFTRGQPKELIKTCFHMNPVRGYQRAKNLLKEHFGNEFKISNAYIEKALSWPSIKPEDPKGLQAFALYLRGCCNVMEEMAFMEELDLASNL